MTIAPYSGSIFWGLFFLFVFLHACMKPILRVPWIRNIYMIIFSIIMVLGVQGTVQSFILLPFLFGITILVYAAGKALLSDFFGSTKSKVNITAISIVIFILCYFKYSYFQLAINSLYFNLISLFDNHPKGVEKHIFIIGVSYFSFKFIHFLQDCHNKKISNLSFLTFLNYILFFPNFFSGPINRYNSFSGNLNDKQSIKFSDYPEGGKRIINGLFKKVVLANNLLPFSIVALDLTDPSLTPLKAILGIYAYMLYAYFDFSGYSDMAIGGGKMVGIDLPENFNYPFFKRNLQQFWANWHMSLTQWLTDYIYWPLVRKMRHVPSLRKLPVTNSNICIIITFMVCGIWHGDGIHFFLWGSYHGIGLALLNVYTYIEKKYFKKEWIYFINRTKLGYSISTLITFQYAAFGFLLFGYNIEQLKMFFGIFI